MASLVWAILGLVLIGSEFIVPEFVIFFFGLGALAMSLLTALLPGLGLQIPLQIVLWLAMSGVSLFALRRTFSRVFKGSLFDRSGDQDAGGQTARVTERGYAVAVGDLARDGHPEVAASAWGAPGDPGEVAVWSLKGEELVELFRAKFPGPIAGLATGDINGDGRVELIVAVRSPERFRFDLYTLI